MRTIPALSTVLLASLSIGPALAQEGPPRNGYDLDIEIIKPMFTSEIHPGLDVPLNGRAGTVRGGIAMMYQRNPLVLYEFDDRIGPVVANRANAYGGVSFDITNRFTLRAAVPVMLQWGSQIPRYASDGFAVGDIMLGGHGIFARGARYGVGLRADLALPTSRADFYAGERVPRTEAALIMMFDLGRVRLMHDIGSNIRFSESRTTEDFTLGSELVLNNALSYNILPDRLSAGVAIYSRFGFNNFFGAAESTGEALASVGFKTTNFLWINASAGRGFTKGYGSTDFRGYIELRFIRTPPVEEDPDAEGFVDGAGGTGGGLQFNVKEVQSLRGSGEGELSDAESWDEGEKARWNVERKRIEIRDAIQFEVGTSSLRPESFPILDYMAELLNDDARLGHVIIEGHASTDGEYRPNYELSVDRARAIWERLIAQCVHPSRVSFRGMGEVVPPDSVSAEYTDLEAARRVEFHVVRQYDPILDPPPKYDTDLRLPWDGEPYRACTPRFRDDDDDDPSLNLAPRRTRERDAEDDTIRDVDFNLDDDFEIDGAGPSEPDAPAEPSDTEDEPTSPDEETP